MEEAVLGAVILEGGKYAEVCEIINEDDFYVEQHKAIWKAIKHLGLENSPIDMRTVVSQLKKLGLLELAGGMLAIATLTSTVSSSANVKAHAAIIKEMSLRREVIRFGSKLHAYAYDDTINIFETLDDIQRDAIGLSTSSRKQKFHNQLELYTATLLGMQNKKAFSGITGVPTGFRQLNRITSGWQPSDLIIIAARPGMGKALSLNENILTRTGWIKMKNIKLGDMVASSDGSFYPVTGVYPQGKRDVYDVTFDDGTVVRCDEDHLWKTQSRSDRKRKETRVIPLSQIIKEGIILRNKDGSFRKNFSIEYCQPVNFGSRNSWCISPYVLGVLLGDGMLTKGAAFCNPENDVVEKVQALLPNGYAIKSTGITRRIRLIKPSKNNPILRELKRLELLNKRAHEKHIPAEYLFASPEDRLNLLRGLIDTDGFVCIDGASYIEYSTTSKELADGITDLSRSLGARVTASMKIGAYRKDGVRKICRLSYRINISFPNGVIPVSSKKHLAKYGKKTFHKKFIVAVEYAGKEEAQCISVASPDRTFLTNNYTVTHNTAFLLCTTLAADRPVGIFSLEMAAMQLEERLMSITYEINNERIKHGYLEDHQWAKLAHDPEKLAQRPIFIDDSAFLTISELWTRARRMKVEHNIGMIIVDYLQLMSGDKTSRGNREQEISAISRGLKQIAKELGIPVIALSQLSRSVETRGGDKRPQLSDLRESGSIEQDADMVIFLYRAEYYKITVDENGMPTKDMAEAIIAKHRGGDTGTIEIRFHGPFTKFLDVEPRTTETRNTVENVPGNFVPLDEAKRRQAEQGTFF